AAIKAAAKSPIACTSFAPSAGDGCAFGPQGGCTRDALPRQLATPFPRSGAASQTTIPPPSQCGRTAPALRQTAARLPGPIWRFYRAKRRLDTGVARCRQCGAEPNGCDSGIGARRDGKLCTVGGRSAVASTLDRAQFLIERTCR